jgi:hypothetical protein
MSGEPTTSPSGSRPQPGHDDGERKESRPWTPAAAMEPVPPLAPPPARPGAGTPVVTAERTPTGDGRGRALVGLVAVAVVIVALVIVLLAGH